jgi:mono/diheme cytochrome c family protein
VLLIGVLLGGAAAYVAMTWDRRWEAPLPDLHASTDPAVIARGEYFVYGPSHCAECHLSSLAEYEKVAHGERPPLVGGTAFAAAPIGIIYSKNLTPDAETGIGRYSDPQIARMMRYAVRPDGHASVQPLMPFERMSDEDAVAILSYLRAQLPVRHEVPANEWWLVGKIVKSFAPVFKPRTDIRPPRKAPPPMPTRERGEYLARSVANCVGCHSPHNQLTFSVNGVEFSGGTEMEPMPFPNADPGVWFIPPNLTPQKGSALDKFPDRETFVARVLKGGRQHAGSPMPWESFARMAPEDAGALYEFLKALPPADGPSGEPKVRH